MTQEDLFREPAQRKKRGTPAPDQLTHPQLVALQEWAEEKVPWLRREALESFESVESHIEECLDWWRGDGGLKVNWPATIRNRIQKVERERLASLVIRKGNQSAREALRDPKAWAEAYDARARASNTQATWEAEPIEPRGGGAVVDIGTRRPRR